jgi:hypothetical protein
MSSAVPVVEEVLRFEDLPIGSLGTRRAVVRWSDGTDGEGLTWYGDYPEFGITAPRGQRGAAGRPPS